MTYDGHDRQARWLFPSPTTTGVASTSDYEEYGYDANGNRTSLRKRDGSTINYQYDALNRNTVKIIPERSGLSSTHTRDVYYGYNYRGLQTYARFDNSAGEGLTTTYDGFGRMTLSALSMDGVTRTLAFFLDKNGNRRRTSSATRSKPSINVTFVRSPIFIGGSQARSSHRHWSLAGPKHRQLLSNRLPSRHASGVTFRCKGA